jgi:hypothetical protein
MRSNAGCRNLSQLTVSPVEIGSLTNIGEADLSARFNSARRFSVSDGSSGFMSPRRHADQNLILFRHDHLSVNTFAFFSENLTADGSRISSFKRRIW